MCLFSDVWDTESLCILTKYLTESSQDGKVTWIPLHIGKHNIFWGGSELLTLHTLCVLMFLHWSFIIFIHDFSLLGLVFCSLDVLLLFWTSFLTNLRLRNWTINSGQFPILQQLHKKLHTEFRGHWPNHAFYHRSQYNSSPFPLQKEIVLKILFQGY